MSDTTRLLRLYRPYVGRLIVAVSSLLLVGAISVLLASLTISLMAALEGAPPAEVTAAGTGPESSSPASARLQSLRGDFLSRIREWIPRLPPLRSGSAVFVGVGGWLLVLMLLRSVFEFLSSYTLRRVGLDVVLDLRNRLFGCVLGQPLPFFWHHPTGALMSRITGDVGRIQRVVSGDLADMLRAGSILLGQIIFVFYLYPGLSFMLVVVLPLVVWPIVRLGRKLKRTSRKSQERMAELSAVLSETLAGVRVVKAFGAEAFERGRFARVLLRAQQPAIKAVKLTALTAPVIDLAGALALATFLVIVSWKSAGGEIDLRTLPGFLVGLSWSFLAAKRLARLNNSVQQGMAAVRRVFQVMDLPQEPVDDPTLPALGRFLHSVEFSGVRFAYGRREALCGIDFTVRAGEVVALVGRSGAGKTTLVSLLPRFFDPTAGVIRLDGRDIRDVRLSSLRAQISFVTQEVVLFDDTVRRNISYAMQDVSQGKIEAAARAACADGFIRALPQGYETRIGEAGVRLSAGQRQRLAIARAILRDTPILILDEATSALDAESEALLQKAFDNLMRGRTVFVIAHRLSTVRGADRILVLDGGRIIESGSHAELMEGGRLYRRFHDLQFQNDEPIPPERSALG
ncbi:MAG: ABC transporter transmembrane domain-containing protein [Acidobacteriota bacterium]